MSEELIKHEPSGLWIRDNTDISVIKEQFPMYKELKELDLKGTFLDLGGFIGTFVWFAKEHLKPTHIVSVEPQSSSWRVHEVNFQGDPMVTLLKAAVVENGPETINLYLGKTYPSCSSLQPIRGRSVEVVKTVEFKQLLDEHKPVLIKCDIEGGEYLLDWGELPEYVKSLCFEFHHSREGWLEKQIALDECLLAQGFTHVKAPKNKITYQRTTIGIYAR